MTTHKMSKSREYAVWRRMKNCVHNPTLPSYNNFGAKGVTICSEWEDFGKFVADMGQMPNDMNGISLINPLEQFCKENCVWSFKNGRKQKNTEKKKVIEKKKPKKILEPRNICLILEKELLEKIRAIALQKSVQEGRLIEANELIRETLTKAFLTAL